MLSSCEMDAALKQLACPICRGPLSNGQGRLGCPKCALGYPCQEGVFFMGPPFLVNGSNGAGQGVMNARMHELAADAGKRGWDEAQGRFSSDVLTGRLRAPRQSQWARARAKVAGGTWEDTLQDLVDPTRAGWKFLLDVRATSTVCFLGPSWGAAPLVLARSCASVLMLDGSPNRLRLVFEQARGSGLENLTVARVSDALRLPLADHSVDVVVVPGIAEWFEAVAASQPLASAAGNELLAEIRRVIAAGGQAYVGTENRQGVSRLLDLGRARAVRYSVSGLKAGAAEAGFADCSIFAPLPFRHKFHQILEVGRTDRMNFCVDPYRTRGRVLRPLVRLWDRYNRHGRLERHLYRYLPGLSAVLSADAAAESFGERVIRHVGDVGNLPPAATALSRYYVRPKGVVVLVAGSADQGGLIVRLPLADGATASCERQHQALNLMAGDERIPVRLRRLFPAPVASGRFDGQPYFAETGLRGELGRLYYSRSERRFDRAIANAAAVLCELRRATEHAVLIDEAQFGRVCGDWLDELRNVVRAENRAALDLIDGILRDALLGRSLPLGWHHGDYDFANLLYGPDDGVTGILDFEVFDPEGLPLIDLLVLLARRPIRQQGFAFGTLFVRSILERKLPPLENEILEAELRTLNVDDQLYRALALCCWLNHLRLRRDSWLVRSPSWLKDNLHAVIETVRRTL